MPRARFWRSPSGAGPNSRGCDMWLFPEIRSLGQYPEYWARHDTSRAALRTATRIVDFAEFDRACARVEIGRASGRERVGPYVEKSVVGGSVQNIKHYIMTNHISAHHHISHYEYYYKTTD